MMNRRFRTNCNSLYRSAARMSQSLKFCIVADENTITLVSSAAADGAIHKAVLGVQLSSYIVQPLPLLSLQ